MNVAKIGLKLAGLGLLCVLAGCNTQPTMAELEQEASKTGDWSEVERREARDKAWTEETTPKCPENLMNFCVTEGPRTTCTCVSPAGVEQR
jgi:hypothetical protein